MKLSLGIFVSLASAAVAQTSQQLDPAAQAALQQLQEALPSCAVSCLVQTVPASGCDITDTQCICTNQQLAQTSQACLGANCTIIGSLQTKRFQDQMCGIPVRSRQDDTIRVNWALWTFSTLVVIARFAARSPKLGGAGYGYDDWMSIVTHGFVTAIAAIAYLLVRDGLGVDIWNLDPWQITAVLRWFWLEQIIYSFAVCSTKISIVLLYLRIFTDKVSTGFRRVCFGVIAILMCQLIAFSVSAAFQCDPVSFAWTQWDGLHQGQCVDIMAQIYVGSAVNITMDLVVFVLPIPRLLKIQISNRKKFGICLTFLVGLFVTLCSIIRLYYVVHWRTSENPTWTNSPVGLWSIIEIDVGIICACMPALSGPIKKIYTKTIGTPLSNLYASRKERSAKSTGATGSSSQAKTTASSSAGWRSISRQGEMKPGVDSIMCNVSLNVSDEIELVDKHGRRESGSKDNSEEAAQGQPGGWHAHDYRERW